MDAPATSANFAHALPFGAQSLDDRRTRFRVWAPSARRAAVVLDDGNAIEMTRESDGWFSTETACSPGRTYRYRFDDAEPVPDPASRAQAGAISGASIVVDARAYRWQHPDWRGRPWHEAVVYELHAGVCGGFDGVRGKLAGLRDLGVTVVELMPVAEFPGRRNWGYDGVLPFAPSSSYGTPDQLKALIDEAHGHGLAIMLDVVYNHFGPEGNHLGAYAADFFRDDIATPWGRAIDFRREEVREFFIQNAIYWINEFRFDGLRLDAVHAIVPNDWLIGLAARVRAAAGDRIVHLVLENDANAASPLEHGFDAQWNDDFHHAAHVLLTGETQGYYCDYAKAPAAELARCLAEGFAYQGRISAHRDGALRGESSAHLPPTSFVAFLQNHDQVGNRAFGDRLDAIAPAEPLHVAFALLLLAPQIPLLWMGQEWGSRRPFLFFADYEPPLADAVRDGRRREFAAFDAFRDPAARARIPDPNAMSTFEASIPDFEAATHDEGAVAWRRTQRLLAIRREVIVPRLAGAQAIGAVALGERAVTASWRLDDGSRLALFANFGDTPVEVTSVMAGRLVHQTSAGARDALLAGVIEPHALIALLEDGPGDVG